MCTAIFCAPRWRLTFKKLKDYLLTYLLILKSVSVVKKLSNVYRVVHLNVNHIVHLNAKYSNIFGNMLISRLINYELNLFLCFFCDVILPRMNVCHNHVHINLSVRYARCYKF